eukprot:UN00386
MKNIFTIQNIPFLYTISLWYTVSCRHYFDNSCCFR